MLYGIITVSATLLSIDHEIISPTSHLLGFWGWDLIENVKNLWLGIRGFSLYLEGEKCQEFSHDTGYWERGKKVNLESIPSSHAS